MASTPEERERWRIYRETHRELLRAKAAAHLRKNHENIRTRRKELYAEAPERHRQYAKESYARHTEKARKTALAYYHAHRKVMLERQRAYRQKNREKARNRLRTWQIEHPERIRASNAKRRARKANAPQNDLTHQQWMSIQEMQNHRCAYCGKRCKGKLAQDHITPLGPKGSHTLHNVIGACRSCNSKKHTGPPLVPVQPFLLTSAPTKKKGAT